MSSSISFETKIQYSVSLAGDIERHADDKITRAPLTVIASRGVSSMTRHHTYAGVLSKNTPGGGRKSRARRKRTGAVPSHAISGNSHRGVKSLKGNRNDQKSR